MVTLNTFFMGFQASGFATLTIYVVHVLGLKNHNGIRTFTFISKYLIMCILKILYNFRISSASLHVFQNLLAYNIMELTVFHGFF